MSAAMELKNSWNLEERLRELRNPIALLSSPYLISFIYDNIYL